MLVDLSQSRENYFRDWTPARITHQFLEVSSFRAERDLPILNSERQLVVCTAERDLAAILNGDRYSLNPASAVSQIDEADSNQLIVLPPEDRRPSSEARTQVVYSRDSLISLDSLAVARSIAGAEVKRGRLSGQKKMDCQFTYEKGVRAAVQILHDHADYFLEKHLSAFSVYGGKDHRLRVFSLIRQMEGLEGKIWQNLAAFKLMPKIVREEINTRHRKRDGAPLTDEQIARRLHNLSKWQLAINKRGLQKVIDRLDVSQLDLVKPDAENGEIPFNFGTGHYVRVPSMTRPIVINDYGKKERVLTYQVSVFDFPFFPSGDPHLYSAWGDLFWHCTCLDHKYRSNRRKSGPTKGSPDYLACHHLFTALLDLGSTLGADSSRQVGSLPVLLQTEAMQDYLDKLRYQTVILDKTPTDQWTVRSLNYTEMEEKLFQRLIVKNLDSCFGFGPKELYGRGDDVYLYVFKFKN